MVKMSVFQRVSSMVHQYQQGLDSCGQMWKIIKLHWRQFLPVFCDTQQQLTRTAVRALFQAKYSDTGTMRHEEELDTMFAFEQWLVNVEGKCQHISNLPLL